MSTFLEILGVASPVLAIGLFVLGRSLVTVLVRRWKKRRVAEVKQAATKIATGIVCSEFEKMKDRLPVWTIDHLKLATDEQFRGEMCRRFPHHVMIFLVPRPEIQTAEIRISFIGVHSPAGVLTSALVMMQSDGGHA